MRVEVPGTVLDDAMVTVDSSLLDMWFELGAILQQLGMLSAHRRDIEISIYNGQIRAGYHGELGDDMQCRAGTLGIEPLVDNWRAITRLASTLPPKP